MKKKAGPRKPFGELRQSQVITTFGPGAMLDLPDYSVLVGGLDDWTAGGDVIPEPRLAEKVAFALEKPTVELRTPPPAEQDPTQPATGITAWQFPQWFLSQEVQQRPTPQGGPPIRTRRLVHQQGLTNGKVMGEDRKRKKVVPIRFVRACPSGHIGDIDWYAFVHGRNSTCRRPLWYDERGTSGDQADLFIRCECGQSRSMAEANDPPALGHCDGLRPWLGLYSKDQSCGIPNRLLVRTASNTYFPQVMRAISLPDRGEDVRKAVASGWDFLSEVEDIEQLGYEKRKAKVRSLLEGFSNEEILAEIVQRRTGMPLSLKSVKLAELETLVAAVDEWGDDETDSQFLARTLPRDVWDASWMTPIERVVLVHRLREVSALLGFTRLEAESPDKDGEIEVGVRRAALAREAAWVPAAEIRGEGIFLQFRREAIEQWRSRSEVYRRGRKLDAGFEAWLSEHSGSGRKFPGLPYVMLHSLSHLLIAAVSLECGYPASSIRERIYAIEGVGYGILLYTGTSDAEGTLGGLVQTGERIREHIRQALESGQLCSNDPVCATHDPANPHEHRFLHGAACHGCELIAETSCEQHNEFLDRALVVPTIEGPGVHFFPRPDA